MTDKDKWICVSAYLFFIIPFMIDKDNDVYRFHGNQGLDLLILTIIVGVIGTVIPIIGWFIILPLGILACLALLIMGVMNALQGKMKELPVIGKVKIIK